MIDLRSVCLFDHGHEGVAFRRSGRWRLLARNRRPLPAAANFRYESRAVHPIFAEPIA
jgi:hypothetical protein